MQPWGQCSQQTSQELPYAEIGFCADFYLSLIFSSPPTKIITIIVVCQAGCVAAKMKLPRLGDYPHSTVLYFHLLGWVRISQIILLMITLDFCHFN